jgi:peptidoglycan hydrolase FlgJ
VAINPPSDIVLGAVLAADPARYQAAVERLQRAGGDAGAGFEAALAAKAPASWETRTSSEPTPPEVTIPAPESKPAPISRPAGSTKTPDAFTQLEAFVLQSFIETMLPSNAQGFFGKGTAGEVWKSMLAEKLGTQIASSGQLGLARRLAEGRNGSATVPAMLPDGSMRMSQPLTSLLPYIQGAVSAEEPLTARPASATERS